MIGFEQKTYSARTSILWAKVADFSYPNKLHRFWTVSALAFSLGLISLMVQGVFDALSRAESGCSLTAAVFLKPSVTDGEAKNFAQTLRALAPGIGKIDYHSRDEALLEAQNDPTLAGALALIKGNPLPAYYVLQWRGISFLRNGTITQISSQPSVQEVRWNPDNLALAGKLRSMRVAFLRISLIIGICFFVWISTRVLCILKQKTGYQTVLRSMGYGLLGGATALIVWMVIAHRLPGEAAPFIPGVFHWSPLFVGALSGLGVFL
jgi:cell division protein FtsX